MKLESKSEKTNHTNWLNYGSEDCARHRIEPEADAWADHGSEVDKIGYLSFGRWSWTFHAICEYAYDDLRSSRGENENVVVKSFSIELAV